MDRPRVARSGNLKAVGAVPAIERRSVRRRNGLAVEVKTDPGGLEKLVVTAPEFDATFEVYGHGPVQAFGTVLGRELYFRARHDGWSFDVADQRGHLPSDGYFDSDGF